MGDLTAPPAPPNDRLIELTDVTLLAVLVVLAVESRRCLPIEGDSPEGVTDGGRTLLTELALLCVESRRTRRTGVCVNGDGPVRVEELRRNGFTGDDGGMLRSTAGTMCSRHSRWTTRSFEASVIVLACAANHLQVIEHAFSNMYGMSMR